MITLAGVTALSFDALLVRLAEASVWTVAFWRGGFMAISLSAWLILRHRRHTPAAFRLPGWPAWISSVLFAATGFLFVASVSLTDVANTVVILCLSPLAAGVFTSLFLHERVGWHTWVSVFAAIAGVVLVFRGSLGSGHVAGDLPALAGAVVVGANHTLLRRHREVARIPVVCWSGLFLALLVWLPARPWDLGMNSWLALGTMGLVQMPTALVLTALGTQYLPAPQVTLFLLLEVVLAPLWVWMLMGEQPAAWTFVGGGIVGGVLILHSWWDMRTEDRH